MLCLNFISPCPKEKYLSGLDIKKLTKYFASVHFYLKSKGDLFSLDDYCNNLNSLISEFMPTVEVKDDKLIPVATNNGKNGPTLKLLSGQNSRLEFKSSTVFNDQLSVFQLGEVTNMISTGVHVCMQRLLPGVAEYMAKREVVSKTQEFMANKDFYYKARILNITVENQKYIYEVMIDSVRYDIIYDPDIVSKEVKTVREDYSKITRVDNIKTDILQMFNKHPGHNNFSQLRLIFQNQYMTHTCPDIKNDTNNLMVMPKGDFSFEDLLDNELLRNRYLGDIEDRIEMYSFITRLIVGSEKLGYTLCNFKPSNIEIFDPDFKTDEKVSLNKLTFKYSNLLAIKKNYKKCELVTPLYAPPNHDFNHFKHIFKNKLFAIDSFRINHLNIGIQMGKLQKVIKETIEYFRAQIAKVEESNQPVGETNIQQNKNDPNMHFIQLHTSTIKKKIANDKNDLEEFLAKIDGDLSNLAKLKSLSTQQTQDSSAQSSAQTQTESDENQDINKNNTRDYAFFTAVNKIVDDLAIVGFYFENSVSHDRYSLGMTLLVSEIMVYIHSYDERLKIRARNPEKPVQIYNHMTKKYMNLLEYLVDVKDKNSKFFFFRSSTGTALKHSHEGYMTDDEFSREIANIMNIISGSSQTKRKFLFEDVMPLLNVEDDRRKTENHFELLKEIPVVISASDTVTSTNPFGSPSKKRRPGKRGNNLI